MSEPKTAEATAHHPAMGHVVPIYVLLGIFSALIVLTVVTVAVANVDLGAWNLPIAMLIATTKASLVVLYFMHLRYDQPFNALVFVTALVFLALFISLTLLDTYQYQGDVQLEFLRDMRKYEPIE